MQHSQLLQEGYQPTPPKGGLLDAGEMDGAICATATCENCGHKGLEYKPYSKPGSYRPFAVCPECGERVEF